MKSKKLITTVLGLSAIGGTLGFTDFFIKDDPMGDVRDFTSEVKSSMHANDKLTGLEPEKLQPYKPYQFQTKNQNPFSVKDFVRKPGDEDSVDNDDCASFGCGDGAPIPHAQYFLETFNLDQLSMIGSMRFSNRGRVALIQTPSNNVVYAAKGEYIGRNNGLILSVEKNKLIVREKYRSPKGWQDRMAKLSLVK